MINATAVKTKEFRILDLNKINKGVTAKQASQVASTLGVQFRKSGAFKKWVSAKVGTKVGSYGYTEDFKYNGKWVVLCFCKFNGADTGSLGLVELKLVNNVREDIDLAVLDRYHYIADYLV